MGCDIHLIVEKCDTKLIDKFAERFECCLPSPEMLQELHDMSIWTVDGIPTGHKNYKGEYSCPTCLNRNYDRFGELAGVRNRDVPKANSPLGIPKNASSSTKRKIEEWGLDGHSHSSMALQEACEIFINTEYPKQLQSLRQAAYKYFGVDYNHESELALYRIVFWFDN